MSDDDQIPLTVGDQHHRNGGISGFSRREKRLAAALALSLLLLVIAVTSLLVVLGQDGTRDSSDESGDNGTPSPPPPVPPPPPSPPMTYFERALAIQAAHPLIDGHNDLPWELRAQVNDSLKDFNLGVVQPTVETDIPRLRKGEVGGQFWSVYVPCSAKWKDAVRMTMEQIDVVRQMTLWYPDAFQFCDNADCIENAFGAGRVASLVGMEGGHSIDSSLGALRMFYDLGARYMTLTHSCNTPWAQSCSAGQPPVGGTEGITSWGKLVVKEMNRMGMLVDLSHVSHNTMRTVLSGVTEAPVIFSHSSAYAICDNPRNVPDDVLKMLPANGGVVMVNFYINFLNCSANPTANIDTIVDHINHIRDVAGIDHVGLGSDFDGVDGRLPVNMTDVSHYPYLTARLLEVGYSDADVIKIIGGNVVRVFRHAEEVSARMKVRGHADNEWLYGYNFAAEGDQCRSED